MNKDRIVIFSTIDEDWGGSEELWAKSIPYLQSAGYEIYVLKSRINFQHPKFIDLAKNNVQLLDLIVPPIKTEPLKSIIYNRITSRLKKEFRIKEPKENAFEYLFVTKIKAINPALVIIAQGVNFDGLEYAHQFFTHKIPYVTLSQKAVDFFWPNKNSRPFMKVGLLNALKCFFVSKHNLFLTEEQFGCRLPNSVLINNPIKLKKNIIPYPSTENGYHVACIGRLFLLDKGQDILIKLLSSPIWKARPLYVSFIGEGVDYTALMELADLLDVKNVKFIGYVDNISDIWITHHALILPSRAEGMPLAMLEAMAIGRTVIVSNAGGNSEVVIDGENGFVGNHQSFEATIEKAWNARNNWDKIGITASKYIAENYPDCPENDFAKEIIHVLNKN